jgi:hypothetical protein
MATLRVNNLTGAPVFINDVGIMIPAASFDAISNPSLIRDLAASADLRILVAAGTLSLSDGTSPIFLGDLDRYWEGAGFGFYSVSPSLSNERWWMIQQNGGLTTIAQIGFATAPTATGTASVFNDPTAQFINYVSGIVIGNEAGWVSSAFSQTQLRFRPLWKAVIKTGSPLTAIRMWFGLFSATPATADDPAISGMGFRYSTAVDGTAFWRCWSNDAAGGGLVTVTTVPIAADTDYILSIMVSEDATQILFFIDDVLVATHAANLPVSTTNLGHVERVTTLDVVAKNIRISKVALSQRVT